jgi:dihydroxyacetone kinase-like predicted kinase
MPAKKIAISLSSDALALVDQDAAKQGISRSAWFERAAQQARRRQALKRAVAQARALGIRRATDRELEALRKLIS